MAYIRCDYKATVMQVLTASALQLILNKVNNALCSNKEIVLFNRLLEMEMAQWRTSMRGHVVFM